MNKLNKSGVQSIICGWGYAKRSLMVWVAVIPKEGRAIFWNVLIFFFFFFWKSRCHTKRRAGMSMGLTLGTFLHNTAHIVSIPDSLWRHGGEDEIQLLYCEYSISKKLDKVECLVMHWQIGLKVVDSTEHCGELTLVVMLGKMIGYTGNFTLPGYPINFLSFYNGD